MQYISHQQLIEQRFIELGYNPATLQPSSVIDYFNGDAWAVFGITSYGKSILVGNLAVQFAKHRNLIIFDYNGAYRNLKYVNYRNNDGRYKCISDLVYLHRFGFKIEDMKNAFDWEMMGLTSNAANLCASFAKQVIYHKNKFSKFREMVQGVQVFGKEGGQAWHNTKNSILAKLDSLKGLFVDFAVEIDDYAPERIQYRGAPFYVRDWKAFFKKHRHICLNMNSEYNPAKAQFMAGKLLNEIEPIAEEICPVIVLEEAHELLPKQHDERMPYSKLKLLDYLKEKHKKGVKIIIISQSPEQISEMALDEIKRFFFGKLQNIRGNSKIDEMFKMSMALNYNYIDNKREFWHYSPLYNEKGIFQPYDSYTFFEKRR